MRDLFRQIHLDFHTTPSITPIGENFDMEVFAKTLVDARVNSINIFAKCHHGMCYHPTKVGTMHPGLSFDIFGEMVKVLHKYEINAVAYIPIGWEETAAHNLNWVEVTRNGLVGGKHPLSAKEYEWRKLCLNKTEYMDYIYKYIDEIMENYDIDGLWFDIVRQYGCVCDTCREEMLAMGMNPLDEGDVRRHDLTVTARFENKLTAYVNSKNNGISIYYNGGWELDDASEPEYSTRNLLAPMTHMEIESLPSELWGYNHFPLQVNYFNKNSGHVIGMNGKFHLAWGDHGSLRNKEALEYECFRMIANGAMCCIGDQLHPNGMLDHTVYGRIGEVFQQIEAREPWCKDSTKQVEIAVMISNQVPKMDYTIEEGVIRILTELHLTFDFIDRQDTLDRYRLLILPDEIIVDKQLQIKIEEFIKKGGKLIATYHSGVNEGATAFALNVGGNYEGEYTYMPSYFDIDESFEPYVEPMSYLSRFGTAQVTATDGTVHSFVCQPYSNRTYDNFSSHMHFPCKNKTQYANIISKDKSVVYISAPVFRNYIEYGDYEWRQIISKCMELLDYQVPVRTDLPLHCEVTLRSQMNRAVLHVVSYHAQRKAKKVDVVDTRIPLYDHKVWIRDNRTPKWIYTAPDRKLCEWKVEGEYIEVQIPKIDGHTMVVYEWNYN